MEKLIPLLKEGHEPPQGFSYKKFSGTFCLFGRAGTKMVRVEVSKSFPWIGVKVHDLAAPK